VCEGQQYDMNFETESKVTLDEYLKMIHLKTAVLLAGSMQVGAIIARTSARKYSANLRFWRKRGNGFSASRRFARCLWQ